MNKVVVRTKTLSQALFGLATAGCDTLEVSLVEHAVKVEGIAGDKRLPLHAWSVEAEDTEAEVGKGETLTEEEHKYLDQGLCPKCADHGQTYKVGKDNLAIRVSCDAGHNFWVPPMPFMPEYLGREGVASGELIPPIEELKHKAEVDENYEAAKADQPASVDKVVEVIPEAGVQITATGPKAEPEVKAEAKPKAEKPKPEADVGEGESK